MTSFVHSIGKIRKKIFPVATHAPSAGLYHYAHQYNDEKSHIHLRINPDGSGILVVNANKMMHLNPTAAWMAYDYLQENPSEYTIRGIRKVYDVAVQALQQDQQTITNQIEELIRPDGLCPIHELDLETQLPFTVQLSAPYRMDLAVTYRCNNDCSHCYNGRLRSFPELDTGKWKEIIDRIWDLAIPHIVFTGGEPTLRKDLAELVAYAGQKGMVTGLNTNGRRLADPDFLYALVDAGLDHVQITLESHDERVHDQMVNSVGAWKETVAGIRNVVKSRLYIMTNTTMLQANSPYMDQTLNFLEEMKVPTIGLNSLIYSGKGKEVGTGLNETQLPGLLNIAKNHTQKTGQKLIWYTPTEYCHFDPVEYGLGIKGCSAALYNMCIEPNGDVIPCQSYYQALGNILADDWKSIWEHPLSISLRERKMASDECKKCSLFVECGGGCPLHSIKLHDIQSPIDAS